MSEQLVYINYAEGVKRVMNNAALFNKLLGKFTEDKNSINDLDTALEQKDFTKAKAVVHTIKGVAANLSLTELNKQSLKLEAQLKDDKADPDLVTIFKDVYSQTKDEVEKVIAENG
jgi:HPt (histidine-containing phosphotransfer) domain-containing protein